MGTGCHNSSLEIGGIILNCGKRPGLPSSSSLPPSSSLSLILGQRTSRGKQDSRRDRSKSILNYKEEDVRKRAT